MAVTASGPISVNNQLLVDALADSATFRARINADNPTEAEARTRIHWPHLDAFGEDGSETEFLRPLAVVQSGPLNYRKYAGGALNHLKPEGNTLLILEDNDRFPNERSDRNSQIDFENFAGNTIKEIAALMGGDGELSGIGIRQLLVASVIHPRERGTRTAFWRTVFAVDWGWV